MEEVRSKEHSISAQGPDDPPKDDVEDLGKGQSRTIVSTVIDPRLGLLSLFLFGKNMSRVGVLAGSERARPKRALNGAGGRFGEKAALFTASGSLASFGTATGTCFRGTANLRLSGGDETSRENFFDEWMDIIDGAFLRIRSRSRDALAARANLVENFMRSLLLMGFDANTVRR